MKKSKKFVLAGFVLLAITGLLALSGCKNDTVPETPAAKLVSISVNPPTRTVYSVGQSFDPTGMVVTATYNAGEPKDVTSLATTDFDTVAVEKGLAKPVTVSYTERGITREDTFTVDVANYKFTETVGDYEYPEGETGTMAGGDYRIFGDWPQTIKDKDVTVGKNTMTRGGMDFHVGSDGNYYVEITAKPYEDTYTYSDGNLVEKDKEVYFKVEPIVWRVLTKDYKDLDGNSTNKALLLAEKILTGGIRYYVNSTQRKITKETVIGTETVTVHANNWQYSTIRAWLNGRYESDDSQAKEYAGKGFLQTAFTQSARDLIVDTSVDNSASSTNPASNPKQWKNGENPYASDTPTTDKVFLLSEKEATTGAHLEDKDKDKDITENYGFDEYYKYVGDGTTLTSTRIRVTTDYAKATGAYQSSTEVYGGWWWLRSPGYYGEGHACVIDIDGLADDYIHDDVDDSDGGVVPALSISLQ